MRIVSVNLQAKPKRGDDAHDLGKILATGRPDVLALQEIGGRIRALFIKARLRRAGMTTWTGAIPTPLAWRSDWELLAKGSHHLSDRTDVGPAGPGPKVLRAKDARWVLLRDPATGQVHFVMNSHLAPSPQMNDARDELHGQQVEAMGAKLAAVKDENPDAKRHAVGDWNTPDRSRLAPITDTGLQLGGRVPTHGPVRQLDYVASDLPGRRSTIRGLRTDHAAIAADLEEAPMPTAKTITQRFVDEVFRLGGEVYTRDQWGSQPDGRKWPLAPDVDDVYAYRRTHKPHRLLPGKPVDTLWQHITVTRDTGPDAGDFFDDMQTLERIGFERFGSGVSYNIAVGMQGEIGIGQPLDAKGTHTVNDKNVPGFSKDQNYVSLAMAYLAMDGAPLTFEAKESMVVVIQALINIGALTRGFDYEPHSLVAWKDCPTDAVREAMPRIHKDALGKDPQPTRVQRARVLFADALELLEATPETRKRVHAALPELQQLLDTLPEK